MFFMPRGYEKKLIHLPFLTVELYFHFFIFLIACAYDYI